MSKPKQWQPTPAERELGVLCLRICRQLADRQPIYALVVELKGLAEKVIAEECLRGE